MSWPRWSSSGAVMTVFNALAWSHTKEDAVLKVAWL
jgi:hypothetical protein